MRHTLLFNEQPLVVNVELARTIGLNEAIVLQQVSYWLEKSDKVYDGKPWTYNSMVDWQKQFPFWSLDTVKRTFTSLEKMELLVTSNFNKAKFDRTKWYTIDYMHQSISANCTNAMMQNALMHRGKMHQPIPKNNSETYTENSDLLNVDASTGEGYKKFKEMKQKLIEKKGIK